MSAMKVYGSGVQLQSFLTSRLDGGVSSQPHVPAALSPWKKAQSTQLQRLLGGPQSQYGRCRELGFVLLATTLRQLSLTTH